MQLYAHGGKCYTVFQHVELSAQTLDLAADALEPILDFEDVLHSLRTLEEHAELLLGRLQVPQSDIEVRIRLGHVLSAGLLLEHLHRQRLQVRHRLIERIAAGIRSVTIEGRRSRTGLISELAKKAPGIPATKSRMDPMASSKFATISTSVPFRMICRSLAASSWIAANRGAAALAGGQPPLSPARPFSRPQPASQPPRLVRPRRWHQPLPLHPARRSLPGPP